MGNVHHLIQQIDCEAYLDGELPARKRRIVERFLSDKPRAISKLADAAQLNLDLNEVRDLIYQDTELKDEIDRLMSKHRKSKEHKDGLRRQIS